MILRILVHPSKETMRKERKYIMKEKQEKDKTTVAVTSTDKESSKAKDKINLDYDWNSEYGDGDIPDIDKQ